MISRIRGYGVLFGIISFFLLLLFNISAANGDEHKKDHGGQVFSAFVWEGALGASGDGRLAYSDLDGWVGTDENKLWIKSEHERMGGETEQAEAQVLYSRNIHPFWDWQAGLRHDFYPDSLAQAVIGLYGLAPYFFETELHLFWAEDSVASLRFRQENDLLITRRLVLQAFMEMNFYSETVPHRSISSGLSEGEAGLRLRYEFTPDFAPYIGMEYEREFDASETGGDEDTLAFTAGLRLLF